MGSDTGYKRDADERARPERKMGLDPGQDHVRTFAKGVSYHRHALSTVKHGEMIHLELVPEPRNPADPRAVALDHNGNRIGYLSAGLAQYWHDYVKTLNRRNVGLYVKGKAERHESWDSDSFGIEIRLPGWPALSSLVKDAGLTQQCDTLLAELTEEMLAAWIDDPWGSVDDNVAKRLERSKSKAPDLSWLTSRRLPMEDRIPPLLSMRVRDLALELREKRRAEREEARRQAAHAKAQAQIERELKRANEVAAMKERQALAVGLHHDGLSQPTIASQLGCSLATVTKMLRAAGIAPQSTYNSDLRDERRRKGVRALQLQRDGKTRAEIAAQLSCSLESVKDLLKDAKFYENPNVDPHRLAFIKQCEEMSSGAVPIWQIAGQLGTTEAKVKAARRDYRVISGSRVAV